MAMRSTVGEAAKWTVEERESHGLRRVLWRPHPMAHSSGQGETKDALEDV